MKKSKRKTIFEELKGHCSFAKEHDYIEVTEWTNGEGYDIDINMVNLKERFQLTYGSFKLLKKLIKELNKYEETT